MNALRVSQVNSSFSTRNRMLAMQTGAGIIPQKPQDGPTTLKISDFTKPSKPEQPEPQPGTERRN